MEFVINLIAGCRVHPDEALTWARKHTAAPKVAWTNITVAGAARWQRSSAHRWKTKVLWCGVITSKDHNSKDYVAVV